MAKSKKKYVCQSCGSVYSVWSGKCDACGEWNTITEEIVEASVPKGMSPSSGKGRIISFTSLREKERGKLGRNITGITEFDRVTGGGLVPGSALLIGGDPGIGKSTLLLQIACRLADKSLKCAYISGEEATDQIKMRATRITGSKELPDKPFLSLASTGNVRNIIETMEACSNDIDVMIIDSIQTMYVDNIDSSPGTVTQVRVSASEIIRSAKKLGIAVIFVGHVTKDGQIAGPRVLEHIVDTVLYFEGDRGHHFRILRSIKNRFGATDEIGVFEMTQEGLREISNPSELFLSERQDNVTGSAVLAALEGTRPVLVEVQALVAQTGFGNPRRAVIGWDSNRLAMILAVLEARGGLMFSGSDVYLNMAGGIRIQEPAADMAVAASLISALTGKALQQRTVFFGEIGLSGEIRPVSQTPLRLKEAAKLGFETAVIAKNPTGKNKISSADFPVTREIKGVSGLIDMVSGRE